MSAAAHPAVGPLAPDDGALELPCRSHALCVDPEASPPQPVSASPAPEPLS